MNLITEKIRSCCQSRNEGTTARLPSSFSGRHAASYRANQICVVGPTQANTLCDLQIAFLCLGGFCIGFMCVCSSPWHRMSHPLMRELSLTKKSIEGFLPTNIVLLIIAIIILIFSLTLLIAEKSMFWSFLYSNLWNNIFYPPLVHWTMPISHAYILS